MRRTAVPRRAHPPPAAPPAVRRARIATVVVAVPAHDEEAHLGRCLRSIDAAAGRCHRIRTLVVVAADRCRDSTVAVARRTPMTNAELRVIEGRWFGASAARAAAVGAGLGRDGIAESSTWLANTDADCTVPAGWLAAQLRHAATGADAVAGVVALDATASHQLRAAFAERYTVGVDAHGHAHAANLGVRAVAYRAAGGWLARAVVGEEHDLLRRLDRRGWQVVRPLDPAVVTSARLRGRVPGGFASWLGRLDRSPDRRGGSTCGARER
jgi:glycosyltransferase involved in cell wall biosynthesis